MAEIIPINTPLNVGRQSINEAIQEVNTRVDNIVADAGSSNIEIVDARLSSSGVTYPILKDRLDSEREVVVANSLEITDARMPVEGEVYLDLKSRLDTEYTSLNAQLAEKANQVDLESTNTQLEKTVNARTGIFQNAIINGLFNIFQERTVTTNPNNLQYVADQWQAHTGGGAPATITHSQQRLLAGEIAGVFHHYRVNFDGAGTNPSDFRTAQPILFGTRYLCGNGRKITVSFWARSSVAGKRLGVFLIQNYGTGGTPSAPEIINGSNVTLTSGWKKYSFTFETNTLLGKTFGSDNNDFLRVSLQYAWDASNQSRVGSSTPETFRAAGTIDFADVVVNAGEVALPSQPRSLSEELALCQFFWEKSYQYIVAPGSISAFAGAIQQTTENGTNDGAVYDWTSFAARKRVSSPTVTIYSPSTGAVNVVYDGAADRTLAGGAFITGTTENGFQSNYIVTGPTSIRRSFQYVADARL